MTHSTPLPPDTVNVQEVLNEHPFSRFQWLIFSLCFLIVLLDGFDTAAIGYIAPSLLAEWGISKPDLAPVLSAALFGLAGGALFAGPLADKLGRKAVLVGSVLVFALACLGSGFSPDLTTLVVLRFVTGVGLGAAMPNAVTLMSEYCPDKRRATLTNAMFCGFPLGAAFGGFLAAWMIPHFGWRSVLYLGGLAPLLLVVALALVLPESVRYMVAHGYALTAASIWWIGQEAGNLGWLVVAVFVAGTIMNTAQSSMPALAAGYYPTAGRATGVAWMLGIGRFGGIAGSFLVAELTVRNLSFSEIFAVVAIPGLIAMAALIVKQIATPKAAPARAS